MFENTFNTYGCYDIDVRPLSSCRIQKRAREWWSPSVVSFLWEVHTWQNDPAQEDECADGSGFPGTREFKRSPWRWSRSEALSLRRRWQIDTILRARINSPSLHSDNHHCHILSEWKRTVGPWWGLWSSQAIVQAAERTFNMVLHCLVLLLASKGECGGSTFQQRMTLMVSIIQQKSLGTNERWEW